MRLVIVAPVKMPVNARDVFERESAPTDVIAAEPGEDAPAVAPQDELAKLADRHPAKLDPRLPPLLLPSRKLREHHNGASPAVARSVVISSTAGRSASGGTKYAFRCPP